jgi:integrase
VEPTRRRPGPKPGSRYRPLAEARTLSSVPEHKNGVRTGFWLARYVDLEGKRRQAARCSRKGDANKAAQQKVNELNSGDHREGNVLTLAAWDALWPERVRRDPRTIRTNQHRVRHYILPHLPSQGRIPLREIDRAMLHDVQVALLKAGLAKSTIDGAFSSLSAVLGYALKEERVDYNAAHGLRVAVDDPLLEPVRQKPERRYVPPDELARFYEYVRPRYRLACVAPVATGCRTQELFALERADRDVRNELILVHQRAWRYGGHPDAAGVLIPGLKTTKGIRGKTKEERGRMTLFPTKLASMAPTRAHRLVVPTVTGRVWSQRNFYRDVWSPAAKLAGTSFTIYDLRHTFVSQLLGAGIPLVEVASYVGHSTRLLGEIDNTTTRIYQHPTGKYRDQALAALGTYLTEMLTSARRGSASASVR